tara:strand:+ start:5640 stop:6428 length:789 start_codon:yes stop_codon:yes gene_type:complete
MKTKGFTLIELIIVTIIIGLLAVVAIPRFLTTISSNEAAVEDAVISNMKAALEVYATDMYTTTGRAFWPADPFDALQEKPKGYISSIDNDGTTNGDADSDGEWTYNTTTKRITHQRQDNSRHYWTYDNGVNVIGGDVEAWHPHHQNVGYYDDFFGIPTSVYDANPSAFSFLTPITLVNTSTGSQHQFHINNITGPNSGVRYLYVRVSPWKCNDPNNDPFCQQRISWVLGESIKIADSWFLTNTVPSDDNRSTGAGIGNRVSF